MPVGTSQFVYHGGYGVFEGVGGSRVLYDGTDYDDGDTVIKKGIVISFNPSSYGGGVSGLPWKPVVRLATTTAGTLATDFDNGSSLDGHTLVTGDAILIKDQVNAAENGAYTVAASGAPTRLYDAAHSVGLTVYVNEGTTNQGTLWTAANDPTVGGNYRYSPVVIGNGSLTYTTTNVSTDRSFDANSTTLDEVADVLGTLIADLQAKGILG